VIIALLAHFWLHETISLERWAALCSSTLGVGFVAQGPSLTQHPLLTQNPQTGAAGIGGRDAMTITLLAVPLPATINPWFSAAMIAAVVLTSTTGEVLTAAAMKSIGDLDVIRAHSA